MSNDSMKFNDVVEPNEAVVNAFHAGAGLNSYSPWVVNGLRAALTRAVKCGIISINVDKEKEAAIEALVDISENNLPIDDTDREFTSEGHRWCILRAYRGMEECDKARIEHDRAKDISHDKA